MQQPVLLHEEREGKASFSIKTGDQREREREANEKNQQSVPALCCCRMLICFCFVFHVTWIGTQEAMKAAFGEETHSRQESHSFAISCPCWQMPRPSSGILELEKGRLEEGVPSFVPQDASNLSAGGVAIVVVLQLENQQ